MKFQIVFLLFLLSLSACKINVSKTIVSINNRQILVNNSPFTIKGVCYHPVSKGSELGNENHHPEWFDSDLKNWYRALNKAADIIHQTGSMHTGATAHGELPDSLALELCPNFDVWGMNVYRWDNPEPIFVQWRKDSSKPMYFSESGTDSYMTITKNNYKKGENEKAQTAATNNILDTIFKNRDSCSGISLFAFVDELWKAGNPDTLNPGGWATNSSGVPYDGSPN